MGMELKSQDSELGTVLLVHGAFHGAWCWKLVVEELEGMGIPVRTVDLPGHGESDLSLGGLGTSGDEEDVFAGPGEPGAHHQSDRTRSVDRQH